MLDRLSIGAELLRPLQIKGVVKPPFAGRDDVADAEIVVGWPEEGAEIFEFVVEVKSRNTRQLVHQAVAQAKRYAEGTGKYPMVMVPYLSPENVLELEKAAVSGVDLCGNGIVVVWGRLWVCRVGKENLDPDSRPLGNPYRGRSAMVARALLECQEVGSIGSLQKLVRDRGEILSLSQISKAAQALEEDGFVRKTADGLRISEPLMLMDRLGREWRRPVFRKRMSLNLAQGWDWSRLDDPRAPLERLGKSGDLKWSITGIASVGRYTTFGQAGPIQVAVTDLTEAVKRLGGTPEPVSVFAEVELVETDEAGFFFGCEVDSSGARWSSRLQAWLESQSGDARQQDAARDLRQQISNPWR